MGRVAGRVDRSHAQLEAAAGAQAPAEVECRCLCGSLLARLVPRGVELKCRRCKRTFVVPLVGTPPAGALELGS